MDSLKALGELRAAGARLASVYRRIAADNPGFTEDQIAAAEAAAATTPTAGPPGDLPVPPTTPDAVRVEHFPGVFYTQDRDPTRGDIMLGQDTTKLPIVRYVDQGCNVQAWGPINRKWKASGNWFIFGKGHSSIFDGANGHEAAPPQPDYTPAGFPISYTLDPTTKAVIGTGSVMHDGRAFNNDAEVLAYIAAQGTVTPPAAPFEMADSYGNYGRLQADAEKFSNVVELDGVPVQVRGSKFGPALEYITNADGLIVKGRPADRVPTETVVRAADGLFNSYPSIDALVNDAKTQGYRFAIMVDDTGVYPGFEPVARFRAGAKVTR